MPICGWVKRRRPKKWTADSATIAKRAIFYFAGQWRNLSNTICRIHACRAATLDKESSVRTPARSIQGPRLSAFIMRPDVWAVYREHGVMSRAALGWSRFICATLRDVPELGLPRASLFPKYCREKELLSKAASESQRP